MVEQHLQDLLPTGIPSVIGELPSSPTDCVAIILLGGSINFEYFGDGTLCTPVAKLVVRNQSYAEAQQWVEDIKSVLHRHHDDFFTSILMQGYPMYLGRDSQKLHEFQIVFNIYVKE